MIKILPKDNLRIIKIEFKILKKEVSLDITTNSIVSFIIGSIVGLSYFLTKHYILNNIIGIGFTIIGII
jgi:hypothetical protein